MCRFVAFLGSAVKLEDLILNRPHNLVVQSYAPKEQIDGSVNLDGFGVGWYNREEDERPAKYATLLPPWADRQFPTIARITLSKVIFASVRNATLPLPTELTSVQPFCESKYMFMHNGHVDGFDAGLRRRMTEQLPAEFSGRIYSYSDSAVLFAYILWFLSENNEEVSSLKNALVAVCEWVKSLGAAANLNFGITDGETAVFFKHEVAGKCNSLYFNDSHTDFKDGCLVVSEPFDDDEGWKSVPDNHLVEIHRGGEVDVTEIG